MTVEKILTDLTGRNIFVLQAAQSGPASWTVTLTVPGDWYYRRGTGSTLAEALDKARTEALKPPPAPVRVKTRVRLTSAPSRGAKRVKLDEDDSFLNRRERVIKKEIKLKRVRL